MSFMSHHGAIVHYTREGNAGGMPVILGHSLLASGRMWDGFMGAMGPHYRFLNMDFRGHGASRSPGAFSLGDLAGDMLHLMDCEHVDSAVLCGLSMGAMTAMRVAARVPDRIKALVFLDTQASAESRINRLKYQLMAVAYRRFGLNALLEHSVQKLMFSPTTLRERQSVVQAWRDEVEGHHRGQLVRAIDAVTERGDFDLRKIANHGIPTLVMVGEDDTATPPEHSRAIAAAMPGAKLVIVPQAGHLSALERPAWVANVVDGFLKAL
jgi:3-oxoadipate enol-lactonase